MLSTITIITPATTARLVDPAAALAACGAPSSDIDAVTALVDQASAAIAAYCGRAFGAVQLMQRFRFNGRVSYLILAYEYARAVSVVEHGGPLDSECWEIDAGILYRLSGFSSRRQSRLWAGGVVDVTYSVGWALPGDVGSTAPALPADIQAACLAVVRAAYATQGRDAAVQREQTEGVGSVSYFDRGAGAVAMTPDVEALLAPYVQRVF